MKALTVYSIHLWTLFGMLVFVLPLGIYLLTDQERIERS